MMVNIAEPTHKIYARVCIYMRIYISWIVMPLENKMSVEELLATSIRKLE